jgi:hypothetical protein
MAERFGASVVIDRPIEKVFAFLADGENDKKFSARAAMTSPPTATAHSSPSSTSSRDTAFGKLLAGFALGSARKDADAFARAIKQPVEAS